MIWLNSVNAVDNALFYLRELSSESEQRRLWLNENNNTNEQSSFTEAIQRLFGDSSLQWCIDKEKSGLSDDTVAKIEELDKITRALYDIEDAGVEKLLEDPRLEQVRDIAASLHDDIARERDALRERQR